MVEADFWHERWESNEIGFHQQEVSPFLEKFWERLQISKGEKVFVPLCGKTKDMVWLQNQAYSITGVDISPIALRDFFAENAISFSVGRNNVHELFLAKNYELYCGDYFLLPKLSVAAVFDRASLIALSKKQRILYVQHLTHIIPDKCKILLITFEYPQSEMSGPPFAVSSDEVQDLFGSNYICEKLEQHDILDKMPMFQKKLSNLTEVVYLIEKKN